MKLLMEEDYRCIEKIKTTGHSYMAAAGLFPDPVDIKPIFIDLLYYLLIIYNEKYFLLYFIMQKLEQDGEKSTAALTNFAIRMMDRLEDINKHSFNNFKLRVGNDTQNLILI